MPGKRVSREPLKLLNGEVLTNRLLKANNIDVFMSDVVNQLASTA